MFTFDHTFGKECTQKELYTKCCQDVLESLMQGFNCTIFAYGQTGTGKTYTMGGNEGEQVELTRWGSFPGAFSRFSRPSGPPEQASSTWSESP